MFFLNLKHAKIIAPRKGGKRTCTGNSTDKHDKTHRLSIEKKVLTKKEEHRKSTRGGPTDYNFQMRITIP